MRKIILEFRDLEKYEENREEGQPLVRITMGMGQRIQLKGNVLENWRITEDLDGICNVTFDFHYATKKHNMLKGYTTYEVQRNANQDPVLVRMWG